MSEATIRNNGAISVSTEEFVRLPAGDLLKMYFSADKPEEAERLVENAFRVRALAQRLHAGEHPATK